MQKSIIILLATSAIALLFQSCSSSSYVPQQNIRVAEFSREEISLMDQATGTDKSIRIYLLGIPLCGRNTDRMYQNAYARAAKQLPGADGIFKPRTEYKGFRVPLILVGFSKKQITVTGRGYRLKSDQELQKKGVPLP